MADCFHHTGRPAVIRCKQCGKGLCAQCRVITGHGVFCSDKCAQAGAVFAERAQALNEQQIRRGFNADGLIRFIILVIVLAVIAWAVKNYFLH